MNLHFRSCSFMAEFSFSCYCMCELPSALMAVDSGSGGVCVREKERECACMCGCVCVCVCVVGRGASKHIEAARVPCLMAHLLHGVESFQTYNLSESPTYLGFSFFFFFFCPFRQ